MQYKETDCPLLADNICGTQVHLAVVIQHFIHIACQELATVCLPVQELNSCCWLHLQPQDKGVNTAILGTPIPCLPASIICIDYQSGEENIKQIK